MKKRELVLLGIVAISSLNFANDQIIRRNKRGMLKTNEELVGVDTYSFHGEERAKNKGAVGSVEIGMDTMMYERSLDEKNRVEPYLGFELFPLIDSNFYIDGKTSYRHEYTSTEKRHKKTMVELYGGSIYRNGGFFLNYKLGVRHDELQSTKVQNSTVIRLIPKATYDFTDRFGWYLKGAIGYAKVQGDERDLTTKEFNTPFQNSDYVNRIETGLSYRIKHTKFSLGVANKSKEEYAGENVRWSYLAKIDHNLWTTNTLQIRPYVWGFLNPEVETGGNNNKTTIYNELGAMAGTRVIYNPRIDLSLTADIVYIAQYKNVSNDGTGGGNGTGSGSGNTPGSGGGNGNGGGNKPKSTNIPGSGGGNNKVKRSVEDSVVIRLGFKKYF